MFCRSQPVTKIDIEEEFVIKWDDDNPEATEEDDEENERGDLKIDERKNELNEENVSFKGS